MFFIQKCQLCLVSLEGEQRQRQVCNPCWQDLPWQSHCCQRCALPLEEANQATLCADCLNRPPAFSHALCAFRYRFPIKQIIPSIKHIAGAHQLHWLSYALGEYIQQHQHPLPDILLPVPLHRSKRILRGFNQAEWLARDLAQQLDLKLEEYALEKVRSTPSQAGLSAVDRRRNLKGSFKLIRPISGSIALVDDVLTTGSTASELSRILLAAGASSVAIWALARTPSPVATKA